MSILWEFSVKKLLAKDENYKDSFLAFYIVLFLKGKWNGQSEVYL